MKAISKAEGDVKKSTDTAKRLQQEINSIECSSESASNEIQEKEAKISEISAKLLSHKQDLHHNSDNLSKLSEEIKKTQFKFESKSLEQSRFQEQISELDQNLQRYSSEKDLIAKDKSIILTKQKEMQQDAEKNLKTLEELERTHSYIAQMEREIGDFDKVQGQEKLEILGKERDRLSKRVNKKVSSTLDDHTKRYDSLISKKGIVANDKQKLSDIITELDSKKLICIQETWQKVDQNLGDIYSMLLPGATAKLDRIDGTEEFVGLEMKVAFNGDWKSNLGELSGGQRSLLALSFILALLKVNPAPIYILDEIDAALDMSHTQNIGMIFKTHFSQSQFIVVSLKEGMFTNANVLFKTQFIEGRSVVERFGINSVRRRN
jgi:structural maintenance of chromosome 2